MPQSIYTKKTIKKVRDKSEIKRNFLRELFFKKSSKSATEEIILELEKGGEYVAPIVTPLESGKPVPRKSRKTNIIIAPNIIPEHTLTPKDMFVRPAGGTITGGESPTESAAKRLGEILGDQEKQITNREELMTAQFLVSGVVQSIAGDAGYEVDYGLENIETLPLEKQWDKDGVDPFLSLDEIISNAEKNGVKVENVVMGRAAAINFIKKAREQKTLSKDLQSEVVKKMIRQHPGVVWLGTHTTYGTELYRYDRTVNGITGEKIELIPTNIIVGGPSGGEVIYGPVVNMTDTEAELHMVERFSTKVKVNNKIQSITTESRPVLQPVDLTGYFSVTVCSK